MVLDFYWLRQLIATKINTHNISLSTSPMASRPSTKKESKEFIKLSEEKLKSDNLLQVNEALSNLKNEITNESKKALDELKEDIIKRYKEAIEVLGKENKENLNSNKEYLENLIDIEKFYSQALINETSKDYALSSIQFLIAAEYALKSEKIDDADVSLEHSVDCLQLTTLAKLKIGESRQGANFSEQLSVVSKLATDESTKAFIVKLQDEYSKLSEKAESL